MRLRIFNDFVVKVRIHQRVIFDYCICDTAKSKGGFTRKSRFTLRDENIHRVRVYFRELRVERISISLFPFYICRTLNLAIEDKIYDQLIKAL